MSYGTNIETSEHLAQGSIHIQGLREFWFTECWWRPACRELHLWHALMDKHHRQIRSRITVIETMEIAGVGKLTKISNLNAHFFS